MGSKVLDVVVNKGNAKEVFLKSVEALKDIKYGADYEDTAEVEDPGESTLADKLSEVTVEDTELDPIQQTTELYKAIFKGIRIWRVILSYSSIQTNSNGSTFAVFDDFCCCHVN